MQFEGARRAAWRTRAPRSAAHSAQRVPPPGNKPIELLQLAHSQRAQHVGNPVVETRLLHLVVPGRQLVLLSQANPFVWNVVGVTRHAVIAQERKPFARARGRLVVTAPPSPVAIALTGWKEKVASSQNRPSPTRLPCPGRIGRCRARGRHPRRRPSRAPRAIRRISAMGTNEPLRWTGSTASARGARCSASASVSGVIKPLSGSTSANTTSAPVRPGCIGRREKSDRRNDHLIARPQIEREARQVKRSRSAAAGHDFLRTCDLSQRGLERLDPWAGRQVVAAQSRSHGGDVVLFDQLPPVGRGNVLMRRLPTPMSARVPMVSGGIRYWGSLLT